MRPGERAGSPAHDLHPDLWPWGVLLLHTVDAAQGHPLLGLCNAPDGDQQQQATAEAQNNGQQAGSPSSCPPLVPQPCPSQHPESPPFPLPPTASHPPRPIHGHTGASCTSGTHGARLSARQRKVYLAAGAGAAGFGKGGPWQQAAGRQWEAVGGSRAGPRCVSQPGCWEQVGAQPGTTVVESLGDTGGTAGCRQLRSPSPSLNAGEDGGADPAGKPCQQEAREGCRLGGQAQGSPGGFPRVLAG